MNDTPYLFQFRKIDNYLFQTLINRTLWFSSPRVFNDPFDCQLPVQADNSLEEITKFLIALNKVRHYYRTKAEVVIRAKELYDDKDFMKSFLRNKFFNERRFSCFVEDESLVYRNSKMWGDYAGKNSGICMRFRFKNKFEESFEIDSNLKLSPLWIKYKNGIPTFNYIRYILGIKQDFNSANQYFIGTKSKEWEDESEVRIILEKTSGEFNNEYVGVKFKAKCLNEVVLGCLASSEDKEIIKRILECNPEYSDVKYTELKTQITGLVLKQNKSQLLPEPASFLNGCCGFHTATINRRFGNCRTRLVNLPFRDKGTKKPIPKGTGFISNSLSTFLLSYPLSLGEG